MPLKWTLHANTGKDDHKKYQFTDHSQKHTTYLASLFHLDDQRSTSTKWHELEMQGVSFHHYVFLQEEVLVHPHDNLHRKPSLPKGNRWKRKPVLCLENQCSNLWWNTDPIYSFVHLEGHGALGWWQFFCLQGIHGETWKLPRQLKYVKLLTVKKINLNCDSSMDVTLPGSHSPDLETHPPPKKKKEPSNFNNTRELVTGEFT